MPILGGRSGFPNVHSLLVFIVGLGGIVFTLIKGRNGDIDIGSLTAFIGLLATPYVWRNDDRPTPHKRTTRTKKGRG